MEALKCKPSAEFDANIGIFGLKTPLHVYVLGEHTNMKICCSRQMLKVRGLSIESRSSTICIDLSMHVPVVRLVSNKPV